MFVKLDPNMNIAIFIINQTESHTAFFNIPGWGEFAVFFCVASPGFVVVVCCATLCSGGSGGRCVAQMLCFDVTIGSGWMIAGALHALRASLVGRCIA